MTIFDEMTKKFGKRCKWLVCDSYCHATCCLLSLERRYAFAIRCELLKLKHYEKCLHVLFPDGCREVTEDMSCFDESPVPSFDYDVDEEMTSLEKDARAAVENEFNDDAKVKRLYAEGMSKYISDERKRLRTLTEKLDLLQVEVEV